MEIIRVFLFENKFRNLGIGQAVLGMLQHIENNQLINSKRCSHKYLLWKSLLQRFSLITLSPAHLVMKKIQYLAFAACP